ncbi:MAG: hypothetical protein PHQ74_14865 [Crocinitomicaceae bacterium]|nr:hypothetical protein [Crocinitomicaceae bacterium]
MKIFTRKNKDKKEPQLFEIDGVKLLKVNFNNIERYLSIFDNIKTLNKVYTKEEIERITNLFSQSKDANANGTIDFWQSFSWSKADESKTYHPLTSTLYVIKIRENSIIDADIHNGLTEEKLQMAYNYVRGLGFIFGNQIENMSNEIIFENIVEYLRSEFSVIFIRHFEYYDFLSTIQEYSVSGECIAFLKEL